MARRLRNTQGSEIPLGVSVSNSPRRGLLGIEPLAPGESADESDFLTDLHVCVQCPGCSNYAVIEGLGSEYRNTTQMQTPHFQCTVCNWKPTIENTPESWQVYYAGRLGGTLVWATNEEHMDILVKYLETNPKRRGRVEFPWEYRALMSRLPLDVTSGRARSDMVSLIKRLQKTKPTRLLK